MGSLSLPCPLSWIGGNMKWFRMYTEVIDDPKMSKLADDEFRVFVYLLMMAAEQEKEGLVSSSYDDISWRLRLPQTLIERATKKLIDLLIIGPESDGWKFINWEKRQFRSDDVTSRVRKHREEKARNVTRNVSETLDETLENRAEQSRTDTSGSSSSRMPCPQSEIVEMYHRILPELPPVKDWSEERQKNLRARWKEKPKRQNQEWWEKYFQYVRESPFLMGGGEKGWTPNLEWLVKKKNLINVIEGKYHGK
jgi:hypothetical protein